MSEPAIAVHGGAGVWPAERHAAARAGAARRRRRDQRLLGRRGAVAAVARSGAAQLVGLGLRGLELAAQVAGHVALMLLGVLARAALALLGLLARGLHLAAQLAHGVALALLGLLPRAGQLGQLRTEALELGARRDRKSVV